MKIAHIPGNLGNQPWTLSRFERAAGLESDLVALYHTDGYGGRPDVILSEQGDHSEPNIVARVSAALQVPLEFDVLHIYYGRSLFSWDDLDRPSPTPLLDLKIAKAMGKRVFATYQGCDVRLAGRSRQINDYTACAIGQCTLSDMCVQHIDNKRIALAAEIDALADKVFYLNPELRQYIPRGEFLPYANCDVRDVSMVPPRTEGPIRIVHAPTSPSIKGTNQIRAALDALSTEFQIELLVVENTPHEEALRIYMQADLVIDQVLLGWYGGLAVEVMAAGKPVICAMRESDFQFVIPQMAAELPLLNVHPHRLVEDLRVIFLRRAEWMDWSRRARDFVLKWHDPARIARALVQCYADPARPFALSD